MAVYRFKISFEDYDGVVREIDIKSNQTFEDLHRAIHRSTGYDAEKSSSFYVSNDQWIKNEEIAFLPAQRKIDKGVTLMSQAKLSQFIDDPHQKFYYTYHLDKPFDFHVELIRIMLSDDSGKEYPCVVRSIGDAPKIMGSAALPTASPSSNSRSGEFDFLNEIDFNPNDAEEIENMNDMGINAAAEEEEDDDREDEQDEFSEDSGDGYYNNSDKDEY